MSNESTGTVTLGPNPPSQSTIVPSTKSKKDKKKKPTQEADPPAADPQNEEEEEIVEEAESEEEESDQGESDQDPVGRQVVHPTPGMGRMEFLTALYSLFGVRLQTDKLSFGGCNPEAGNEVLKKAVKDACAWGGWKEPGFSKQELLDFIQEGADETVQIGGQTCNVNFQRCSAIGVNALLPITTVYFVVPNFEYVRRRDGAVVKMKNMRPGIKCCTIQGWVSLKSRPPLTVLSQKSIWMCVVRSIMKMDAFRGHGLVGTVRTALEKEENIFKDAKHLPPFGISVNGESRRVLEGDDLGLNSF